MNLKTLAMAFFCQRELDFSQITMAIMSTFAACCHELKGLDFRVSRTKLTATPIFTTPTQKSVK